MSGAQQALLQRGFEALGRGDTGTAGRCCQEALEQQPDLVPAHFLVGLVALEARDRRTAFSAFQSVVKLDRDHDDTDKADSIFRDIIHLQASTDTTTGTPPRRWPRCTWHPRLRACPHPPAA